MQFKKILATKNSRDSQTNQLTTNGTQKMINDDHHNIQPRP